MPHKDDIEAAQIRKNERYANLIEECEEAGWSVKHFLVEVGCRGFVGNRLRSWLFAIGRCQCQVSNIIKEIQEVVEKASHWIWLKRNDENWFEK